MTVSSGAAGNAMVVFISNICNKSTEKEWTLTVGHNTSIMEWFITMVYSLWENLALSMVSGVFLEWSDYTECISYVHIIWWDVMTGQLQWSKKTNPNSGSINFNANICSPQHFSPLLGGKNKFCWAPFYSMMCVKHCTFTFFQKHCKFKMVRAMNGWSDSTW